MPPDPMTNASPQWGAVTAYVTAYVRYVTMYVTSYVTAYVTMDVTVYMKGYVTAYVTAYAIVYVILPGEFRELLLFILSNVVPDYVHPVIPVWPRLLVKESWGGSVT